MTNNRVDFFIDGLTKLIDYHRKENDMSYAEVIGVLEIAKADLLVEMFVPQGSAANAAEGKRKKEVANLIKTTEGTCTSCFDSAHEFYTGWHNKAGELVVGKEELICRKCARARGVEGA